MFVNVSQIKCVDFDSPFKFHFSVTVAPLTCKSFESSFVSGSEYPDTTQNTFLNIFSLISEMSSFKRSSSIIISSLLISSSLISVFPSFFWNRLFYLLYLLCKLKYLILF